MKIVDSLKINLGCGGRQFPGYIHVDLDDHDFIDHRHDFRTLPMFDDNTADLIYCCGAFAYIDRDDALTVLKEWNRVLKVGGILRLSVTDFEKTIKLYHDSGDIESLGILGPLFGKWKIKNGNHEMYIYQKTVYDFKSIKDKFEKSGFNNVRKWDWKKEFPPGYDDHAAAYVPHMDFENGTLLSLNVEGEKIGENAI
jgi:predicted SAM-dependent methyltransferase